MEINGKNVCKIIEQRIENKKEERKHVFEENTVNYKNTKSIITEIGSFFYTIFSAL